MSRTLLSAERSEYLVDAENDFCRTAANWILGTCGVIAIVAVAILILWSVSYTRAETNSRKTIESIWGKDNGNLATKHGLISSQAADTLYRMAGGARPIHLVRVIESGCYGMTMPCYADLELRQNNKMFKASVGTWWDRVTDASEASR